MLKSTNQWISGQFGFILKLASCCIDTIYIIKHMSIYRKTQQHFQTKLSLACFACVIYRAISIASFHLILLVDSSSKAKWCFLLSTSHVHCTISVICSDCFARVHFLQYILYIYFLPTDRLKVSQPSRFYALVKFIARKSAILYENAHFG